MNHKEKNFIFNLTKGRIAESLVQELFLYHDYQVYKCGFENNYQYLYKQIAFNDSKTALSLRRSPDLVAYKKVGTAEKPSENLMYIEVKFCGQDICEIASYNLPQTYGEAFPNCHFIIVSKYGFYSISYVEFAEKKRIEFEKEPEYLLATRPEFGLDSNVLQEFFEMSQVFYSEGFLDDPINKRSPN